MTEIKKLSADNNYFYNKINKSDKKMLNNLSENYLIKNNGLEKDTFDYSKNDGKISFKDKVKNFIKGVISPITTMFSSPKNILAGIGTIAVGALLLIATGGALAPVLVAGGVIGGGIQLGIGIYKASAAKTDDEAKQAWQGIGAGTGSVAMSAVGAKSALKAANTNTEGMNILKSVSECFKQTPKSLKNSINSFTSGKAVKNLGNLFTTLKSAKNNVKEQMDTPQTISQSEQAQIPMQKNEISINQNKLNQKPNSPKKDLVYKDDGVFGYDVSGSDIREEMRNRILSHSALTDENLAVQSLDDAKIPQLKLGSKYYELGEPKLNTKSNQYVHIFENLKDMPDGDGLRGKTPLSGRKGLNFKLLKMKDAGIKRVIDLRAKGECSAAARKALAEKGLEYINFPVEDCNWSLESLNNITEYINAVNSGDFYVGCANGQARTDLAVAINYIFNPNSKNVPQLYYGSASSTRVSVKTNILQILELVKENPNFVSDWGWQNYQQFSAETGKKLQYLLQCLSKN